jgi:hypothetical protein
MYVDFRSDWPPPEPRKPSCPTKRLSRRRESVLLYVIGFNLLMLVLAPLAGATVFDAVIALVRALSFAIF